MAMDVSNVYNRYLGNFVHTPKADLKKTDGANKEGQAGQVQLSQKAQALLEKLKKKYGNVDFAVADNEEEAKNALSNPSKEFSVVFSSEELEKMASDESFKKEFVGRVEQAMAMSEQINKEFSFESALGDPGKYGEITKISISVNQDGTNTFTAELEKSSRAQKDRLDNAREERSADKKEEAKKAEKEIEEERLKALSGLSQMWDEGTKKTTVQAGSMEELIQKIKEIDWDSV